MEYEREIAESEHVDSRGPGPDSEPDPSHGAGEIDSDAVRAQYSRLALPATPSRRWPTDTRIRRAPRVDHGDPQLHVRTRVQRSGKSELLGGVGQNTATELPAMHYDAIAPGRLAGFPNPMGETNLTIQPAVPTLRVVGAGLGNEMWTTVQLDGVDNTYDSDANSSRGAAEGEHQHGMAVRKGGKWTGEIESWVQSGKIDWDPVEPADGVYKLVLKITADDAAKIAAFEKEHRDDFRYAWEQTYLRLWSLVTALRWRDTTDGSAIAALVDSILSDGARWLVPEHPADVDSWGPHIRAQFTLLAGQSKERDNKRQHTPTGYVVGVRAKGELTLRFKMGPGKPTTDFLVPASLPMAFTADSFSAYEVAVEATRLLTRPGTPVRYTGTAPIEAFADPNLNADGLVDQKLIAKILAMDKAIVAAQGPQQGQVWIQIEAMGDFSYIATGKFVYILVAAQHLVAR